MRLRLAASLTTPSLHGAPGAQKPGQPFTGQNVTSAGFYTDDNYARAIEWLKWLVQTVRTNREYRNVGMIELVNEPLNWDDSVDSLRRDRKSVV